MDVHCIFIKTIFYLNFNNNPGTKSTWMQYNFYYNVAFVQVAVSKRITTFCINCNALIISGLSLDSCCFFFFEDLHQGIQQN
jgi:hypothetical protein